TGFLCAEGVLMTSRRTLEQLAEPQGAGWQLRPGITAWLNFRSGHQEPPGAGCRVLGVVGVHERHDLALLEVERLRGDGALVPLALATDPPARLEGTPICVVGYPVRDSRRDEPEAIARVFRDVYNVKRVQPGELRGALSFHGLTLLRHDAAPLGHNAGAPVV